MSTRMERLGQTEPMQRRIVSFRRTTRNGARSLPPRVVDQYPPSQDQQQQPRHLPAWIDPEDRTLCLDCRGRGCLACGNTGQVCPICRGLRFVRRFAWSQEHPHCDAEHNVIRCTACMEGNQINPDKEDAVIVAYHHARERAQRETTAQTQDMR